MFWKLTLAIAVIAGLGGVVYVSGVSRGQVKEALHYLEQKATSSGSSESHHAIPVRLKEDTPWNGLVSLSSDELAAIGVQVATVTAQDQPLKLDLNGRTAYDPDTLTKIRPRFDTLVEDVYAKVGDTIKIGDPLVLLHSTDLAAAKSDLQSKYVQWQHDRKLYSVRQELVKSGAISKQQWVDTQNDEMKSRLDFLLARDKLKVLKVPESEIEPLLAPLDLDPGARQYGSTEDKAKMTLVSPAKGIVIERDVVKQNFYDTSSVLMVVAPLDHLWILVNVFELDQDKVRKGQTMEIQFPFLQERIKGEVQFVGTEVDKDTHAVRVRASIPNPGARLKADMLVKAIIDIPPSPGQTIIPRQAMVSSNGNEYVFVRKAPPKDTENADRPKKRTVQFERRSIVVAQENQDQVIVARGLKAGEEVATTGSLILSQQFEDAKTVDSGVPAE